MRAKEKEALQLVLSMVGGFSGCGTYSGDARELFEKDILRDVLSAYKFQIQDYELSNVLAACANFVQAKAPMDAGLARHKLIRLFGTYCMKRVGTLWDEIRPEIEANNGCK